MWLLDIEAPYKFFVAMGRFNYGVSVSYIAAYIFYLITVHYPETKSKNSIYTAASFPAKAIVTNIESIFVDMSKKLGADIKREDLDEDKIKTILSNTKCFGDSTMLQRDKKPMNWIEYLLDRESVIRSFHEKLHPLYTDLDGEYIAAITLLEQDELIKPVIEMINVGIAFGRFKKEDVTFSNGIEDIFVKMYTKAKKLSTTIKKRNNTYSIA